MRMGFGVPVSGSWATPANIGEIARAAERLGYSGLWTFQRLLSPLGGDPLPPPYHRVLDPLTTLAYLAGQTETVRLGLAVVNLRYYSPILLAKALTTLDRLSEGRLDAGLGMGWLPAELEAVGVAAGRSGARADDFLQALRAIWTEDEVDYHGRFYRVPRARVEPKPVQQPHPPILLGGTAPGALARAGRLADGWISSSRVPLSAVPDSIAAVREAAVGAGRDPAALRLVCRAVVKVRTGERGPMTGTLDEIRADVAVLADQGVTEAFVDLNFDPEIGSPEADPAASMRRAHEVLEALAPR